MRNWMRVKEARLDFPSHGLVAVSGNIGTGKTSLGEAVSRTLLGIQGRYSNLGWYSLDEKGDTYVNLKADLDGEPLVVESGFKCGELSKTGEGLRWRLGSRLAVERGHIRETRDELSALLISSLLAEWSVYLDGDRLDFSTLSQSDAVQLLLDALAQPPWDKFHEQAKRQLAQDESDLEAANKSHESAQGRLTFFGDQVGSAKQVLVVEQEAYQKAVAMHQVELDRLGVEKQKLEERLAVLKREHEVVSADLTKTIESSGEAYKQAELTFSRLRSVIQDGRRRVTAWEDASEQAWSDRRKLEQERQAMAEVPDKCPTCGKGWDRRPTLSEFQAIEQQVDAAKFKCDSSRASLEQANSYVKRQRDRLNELEQNLELEKATKVSGFSKRLEAIELERAQIHAALKRVQDRVPPHPTDAAVQVWSGRLLEREASLAKSTADLKNAAELKVKMEKRAAMSRYWVRGLSPTGVPNLVLRNAVAPLNAAAEAVSLAMSGGLVKVVFETDTALASGEARQRLVICSNTKFGAKRLCGNSKGEGGLINLIIAEAQAFVGHVFDKVGYRWLDEAVNSQHPHIHRQVYEYMRQQANERKILTFAVDHFTDVKSLADYTLAVEKDANGYTQYTWA